MINSKQKKYGQQKELSFHKCLPLRLDPSAGRTIYEWICAFFEQTLIKRYYESEHEKVTNKPESFIDYQGLAIYWSESNKSKRIKVR